MEFKDMFGNEIRTATYEESTKYFPVLKKDVLAQAITSAVVAVIIIGMLIYLITSAELPMPVLIFVTALFCGAILSVIIRCIVNICHISAKKLGVLHIYSENIDFSADNSKRPTYYIKATDSATGKTICYSITAKEYEDIRTHFGHVREIDYVVLNPEKIRYKKYSYFFVLANNGCPVLDTAVYDDIDRTVDNLSEFGGIIRVKNKSDS